MEQLLLTQETIRRLHRQCLYPSVMVRTDQASGSGTIVWSGENPKREGEYLWYILTNHHVVSDAIEFSERWDPLLGREVKSEVRNPVRVGIWRYRRWSILDGKDERTAYIVGWDKDADVALLELRSGEPAQYVAELITPEELDELMTLTPVLVVGCSLGIKPLPSYIATLSSLDAEVEGLRYFMSNAGVYFGNSGGACFVLETGKWLGIPSRINVKLIGFGADPIPFLNYIIPAPRVYDLLTDWCYDFIMPWTGKTPEECEETRKEKQDLLTREWERRYRREREIATGGVAPKAE